MHTHFSKSNYKNFKVRHCSHMFPMTQIKTAFQSRVSHRFSNSFSSTGRQFLLLSVLIFYFTDSLNRFLYFAWIYPCAVRSSAHSTAPPVRRCRGIVTFSTGRTLRPFEAPASMSLTFLDAYTGETYHVAASRAKGGAGHALFADAPFSDPAQMIRQLVERLFPERTDHE